MATQAPPLAADDQAVFDDAVEHLAAVFKHQVVDVLIRSGDRDLLTEPQVSQMARLLAFYETTGDRSDGPTPSQVDDEDIEAREQRERRTPKGKMLGLTRGEMPKPVLAFLSGDERSVKNFFAHREEEDPSEFAEQLEEMWGANKPTAAFAWCCTYLEDVMDARGAMDSVRKPFLWLFFYDITQYLNDVYGTNHTGSRVGSAMMETTLSFLSDRFYVEEMGLDHTQLKGKKDLVELWTRRGIRIAQLCREFGEGVVFMLASRLTENMLDNEYRVTEDNALHVETFRILRAAGVREEAEDHGWTQFGKEIRSFLFPVT